MKTHIKTVITLILGAMIITACGSQPNNPYGDPDAQRDRSKDAQDEMRRDTSRY